MSPDNQEDPRYSGSEPQSNNSTGFSPLRAIQHVYSWIMETIGSHLMFFKGAFLMICLLTMFGLETHIYLLLHGHNVTKLFHDTENYVLPNLGFVEASGFTPIFVEGVFFASLAVFVLKIGTVSKEVKQLPGLNIVDYLTQAVGELFTIPLLTVMLLLFFSLLQIKFGPNIVISTETADFKVIAGLSFLFALNPRRLIPLLTRIYDVLLNAIQRASSTEPPDMDDGEGESNIENSG